MPLMIRCTVMSVPTWAAQTHRLDTLTLYAIILPCQELTLSCSILEWSLLCWRWWYKSRQFSLCPGTYPITQSILHKCATIDKAHTTNLGGTGDPRQLAHQRFTILSSVCYEVWIRQQKHSLHAWSPPHATLPYGGPHAARLVVAPPSLCAGLCMSCPLCVLASEHLSLLWPDFTKDSPKHVFPAHIRGSIVYLVTVKDSISLLKHTGKSQLPNQY